MCPIWYVVIIFCKLLQHESYIITHHPAQEYVITDERQNMPLKEAQREGHGSVARTKLRFYKRHVE